MAILQTTQTKVKEYIPTEEAANWCINQSVTHFNNAEISIMSIFAFAYVLLIINSFAREFDKLKWFEERSVTLAKYFLVFGLLVYLLLIKYRVFPLLVVG